MILPHDRSITAADCLRLLEALKRGELDEFDLKNEVNAQWNKGYTAGCADAKAQANGSVARGYHGALGLDPAQAKALGVSEDMLTGDTSYSTQEAAMAILDPPSPTITLSIPECQAIHGTVSELSGSNPEYVFSAFSVGEPDDPSDPTASAFAKVYQAAGRSVPDNLKGLS